MDIGYLLRILARRKWLIFSVMLAASIAMYFLIGRKPEMYRSTVILSTGIVNYKGINSSDSDAFVQEYQVQNAFSNRIEFVRSRSSIKLLTILMLKHDLEAEGNSASKPFRQANPKLVAIEPEDAQKLLIEINKLNLDSISDPAFSQQFDYLLDKVSRSYGYDHDAINRSLEVKRKGDTDYLTIDFTSENAELSQYFANAYAKQFMTFYQNMSLREKRRYVESYEQLAFDKKHVVDTIKNTLYSYLFKKGLPDIGKQREAVVDRISQLEVQKSRAESRKEASKESVTRLDYYIDDKQKLDSRETRDRVVDKYAAADMGKKVNELSEKNQKAGGKDPKIIKELADAQAQLDDMVRKSAITMGKAKTDESKRTKEDLYKTKVDSDLDGIDASKSVSELNREIGSLKGQLSSLVTDDKMATTLQSDQARAEEEFTKVNDEYIKAKLALENSENPFNIIENAQLPEWPEPNHQSMFSLFAGIVAGTLATIAIFMMAFFDSSIQSPSMFKKYASELPLMGSVNTISMKNLDLKQVFSTNGEMPQYTTFRESLRKLRTMMLQSTGKNYLFVSTKKQEGKSFMMNALAHSLAANNKRVLLLDTNFKNPSLSKFGDEPSPNTHNINRALREHGLSNVFMQKQNSIGFSVNNVDVIANTDLHASPSELLGNEQFKAFLKDMGESYDYIFMEAAAMNEYSDARELAQFADKIIAVFNAGSIIKSNDQDSMEFLSGMNGKFAGSVLTEVDAKNMN
jgi:polysaccharide biosynthesis transport protein